MFSLSADESTEIVLTWSPVEKGRLSGTLLISTDDQDALATEVALTGNAIKIDVNSDGVINIFDLVQVGSIFGNSDPNADVNNDGIVNIFDLVAIGSNFGQEVGE